MKRIFVNAGGTSGFIAVGDTLSKVTLATGASTTLTTDCRYTALCYGGDSVLYGANKEGLYSIDQTTGAKTQIAYVEDIDNIAYKDTDEVWVLSHNSWLLVQTDVDTATGTVALSGDAVASVTITNDGWYPSNTCNIVFSGDGTGATGTVTVADGKVTSVTITAGGSGYSSATCTFATGNAGEWSYVVQDL